MGGHNAWRKRVKNGLLAKEGGGGAICRHRPRLGARGKDILLNRKGNIGGGPNKKKKNRDRKQKADQQLKSLGNGGNVVDDDCCAVGVNEEDADATSIVTNIVSHRRKVFIIAGAMIAATFAFLVHRALHTVSRF